MLYVLWAVLGGGGIEFEESHLCKMKTFWETDWLYLFSIIFNLRFPGLLNLGISSLSPLFMNKISSCLYISEVDSRLPQSNPYILRLFSTWKFCESQARYTGLKVQGKNGCVRMERNLRGKRNVFVGRDLNIYMRWTWVALMKVVLFSLARPFSKVRFSICTIYHTS